MEPSNAPGRLACYRPLGGGVNDPRYPASEDVTATSKAQAISTSFGSRVGKQSPTYASGAAITSFPPSTVNHTPPNGVGRYGEKCVIRAMTTRRSGRRVAGTSR